MSIFRKAASGVHSSILGESPEQKEGYLSRTELIDRIYKEFVQRQKLNTTKYGLLFPTNFMVYLSKSDYDLWNETFPYTVKEVVNRFNEVIRKLTRRKYKDYVPHAQFWQFQFSAFPEGGVIFHDGASERGLEPGEVLIMTKIHPDMDLDEVNSMLDGEDRVVTTLHMKNSQTVSQLAINKAALRQVDIRSKDRFRVKFAKFGKMQEVPVNEEDSSPASHSAAARLVVLDGAKFLSASGKDATTYLMSSKIIYIAGKASSETYGGYPVARLDTDAIGTPHLQLRYLQGDEFQVAAWGKTVAAEKPVEPDGQHWQTLRFDEQLLLNGEIAIEIKRP